MKRTFIFDEKQKKFVEKDASVKKNLHFVQGDLEEFRSTDGARIGGRRQWREHLAATGAIEMNSSDLAASREKWASRKSAFQDKLASAQARSVRPVAPPSGEIREYDRSRVAKEMANRLHNRPVPDRKTLIKLTLETERMLRGR